jgi:hypothetical protein
LSVEQIDIVDSISLPKDTSEVVLTVSDHLNWADSLEHQEILQRKLNAYLSFVESGEMIRKYPKAENRKVVFNVVFKFKPDRDGALFLDRARQTVENAGFWLRHELFAESYDN